MGEVLADDDVLGALPYMVDPFSAHCVVGLNTSTPPVPYFDEKPPDMVSSRENKSDQYVPQHSKQVHNAAEANSSACAAAVSSQRNICCGFTDDSDEALGRIFSVLC